jgi:hypothetical protein
MHPRDLLDIRYHGNLGMGLGPPLRVPVLASLLLRFFGFLSRI